LLLILFRCRFQVEGQGKEADTAPEDTVRERIIQPEVNLDVSDNFLPWFFSGHLNDFLEPSWRKYGILDLHHQIL
jgi:hypothetical protein